MKVNSLSSPYTSPSISTSNPTSLFDKSPISLSLSYSTMHGWWRNYEKCTTCSIIGRQIM